MVGSPRANTIIFRVVPSEHAPDPGEVQILIDGVDLRDLVRSVELAQPGSRGIAGKYAGLPADDSVVPPSEHFLGTPGWAIYRYDDKTQVLECECGEPGCWPLVCIIAPGPAEVVWSDFEQPHRSAQKQGGVVWSYDGLGPFRFIRSEYESALATLRAPAA